MLTAAPLSTQRMQRTKQQQHAEQQHTRHAKQQQHAKQQHKRHAKQQQLRRTSARLFSRHSSITAPRICC